VAGERTADSHDDGVGGGRTGLQVMLAVVGAIAAFFGGLGVAQGGAGVHRGGKVSANVDSELRFFASWYTVLGVLVLRAVRRPEAEATVVRACGAGFFLAACGRLLSIRAAGPPSTFFKVLTGIEFAIPAVIVPWQRRVAQAAAPGSEKR
jgi:hypothetical protein